MNTKYYRFKIILIIMTLLTMACSTFGIRSSKEPHYKVIKKTGDIEVREYSGYIVAKTYMAGNYDETSNDSFRRLANYIFGGNRSRQKISMTAPVIQERSGEKMEMTAPVIQEREKSGWTMSFVMPSHYTMDKLPEPITDLITFETIPPRTVAVLTYSGLTSEKKMKDLSQRLSRWIENEGYAQASAIRSARYDPPWTIPFLRRNEIQIDVRKIN